MGLGLGKIPSFSLGPGTWEKFRTLPLYIGCRTCLIRGYMFLEVSMYLFNTSHQIFTSFWSWRGRVRGGERGREGESEN